jgi:MraZ protein
MHLFVGTMQHTLDSKGRLILPAKFRPEFERGGFLTPDTGGCISMWTVGEFTRRAEEYAVMARAEEGPEKQRSRYWAASSSEVEVDRQGRFALPAHVRKIGDLEGEVLIVGHLNRLELWNPERFAARVEPASVYFLGGEDS